MARIARILIIDDVMQSIQQNLSQEENGIKGKRKVGVGC